jgi:hypothetical protein
MSIELPKKLIITDMEPLTEKEYKEMLETTKKYHEDKE